MQSSAQKLADILKNRRNKLDLSFAKIELETKIRSKYLEAFEKGELDKLPPRIYSDRIFKNYLYYLSLDNKYRELKHLLDEAYLEERQKAAYPGSKALRKDNKPRRGLKHFLEPLNPFRLYQNPHNFLYLFTALGIFLVGFYIYNLYANFSSAPDITILEPQNNITISSDNVIIKGFAEPGTIISINGQNIALDPEGRFDTIFHLKHGENIVSIAARAKNGKETTEIRKVNAALPDQVQKVTDLQSKTVLAQKIKLEIKATALAWIQIEKDDETSYQKTLQPGETESLTADTYIKFKTGNAGGVLVTLNDIPKGSLGQSGEVVTVVYGELDETKNPLNTPDELKPNDSENQEALTPLEEDTIEPEDTSAAEPTAENSADI